MNVAIPGNVDHKALRVKMAELVRLDPQDPKEFQEATVLEVVAGVNKAPKGHKDLKDHKVNAVLKDHKAHLDLQEVDLVVQALAVVPKALKEIQVQRVHKVREVHKAPKVIQDLLGLPVQGDQVVHL
ncbi:hypothetical protein EB061_12730 [bacterium]|nr:hypothetical protein [bacterium]